MASTSGKPTTASKRPLYRILHSSGEVLVRNLRHARDLVAERPGARIFRVDTSSWRDAFEVGPT
ncbi:MAG: hypothetical protein H6851_04770 [Geminicoccaceae bacterium]|nr:hypothetical protein [Geminicoccaceae bacterium]MCB9942916.1 hypothetical protein [Geminicoccaceae bacterium]